MDSWLTRARDALATGAGADPAALNLTNADDKTLLDELAEAVRRSTS